MDLPKKYHWNLKFIVMIITLILTISSVSNGSAQVYHFEEDFSGVPDEDWRFTNYVNVNPSDQSFWYINTSNTFTFDNELVSAGEPNSRAEDWAILPENTAVGAWSMDIFVPSDSIINEIWNTRFSISMWRLKIADYENEPNADYWPALEVVGQNENVRFRGYNSTSGAFDRAISAGLKFDTYQQFDLIRTPNKFFVYIDQKFVIEVDLPANIGPEINYFALGTVQGSGIKFDNIQITKDYQDVLDGLPPPDPIEPGLELPLIVWAGIGVVAVVTTFGSWQYFKKKDMKN